MASNTRLLLKTFLQSTSSINVLKYSKDKNKRKYATSSLVGIVILDIVLVVYATMMSVGLAYSGLGRDIPGACALLLLVMPFLFTLLKANGYLFGFKEYDMIMSMPFSVKSIVSGKFWYMYIKAMPMYGLLSLSMLIGYAFGRYLTLWGCIQWIVMTFAMPLIPMVIATALGAIAVKIGSGFRHKNIVQSLLIVVLLLPLIFSRFFIENTIRNDEIGDVMNVVSDSINGTASYIPFVRWFSEAVNDGALSSFLLVVASAILVYELFFILISRFYRKLNSQLSSGVKNKKYEHKVQRQRSMVTAIAFKEFKRMTGSATYFTNAGIGQIMVAIMGIAMLFVKPEVVIQAMMQGAPIDATLVFPGLPMLFNFFLGMVPTTCCSPSLEGKNYWIMKSLPINPMDDSKGKILYNLCISIPFGVFATITTSICFRVSVMDAIASVIAISSLCVFSTIFGLRCGLKHRRLDWENEMEVIKQGMAVSMYILPHIISGLVLMPMVVVANYFLHSVTVIMLCLTLVAWILTLLAWKGVKKYTK